MQGYEGFVDVSKKIMQGRTAVEQRAVVRDVLLSLLPPGAPAQVPLVTIYFDRTHMFASKYFTDCGSEAGCYVQKYILPYFSELLKRIAAFLSYDVILTENM